MCGLTSATRWTACRPRGVPRSGPSSCRRGRLRGPALYSSARSPSSASGAAFPEAGQGMIDSASCSRACDLGSVLRRGRRGGARCRSEHSGCATVSLEPPARLLRRGWWQRRSGCRGGASMPLTRSRGRDGDAAMRGVRRKPRRYLEALLLHLLGACVDGEKRRSGSMA